MLKISIKSFSYKRGIPYDNSGNGGGFVFDCRGLPNPGRLEHFKTMTGNDNEVVEYLKNESATHIFLNAIKEIVSVNIDNYLERDFSHLCIYFGCTGGQHRSVFCANEIKTFLLIKYQKVNIELKHLEIEK